MGMGMGCLAAGHHILVYGKVRDVDPSPLRFCASYWLVRSGVEQLRLCTIGCLLETGMRFITYAS
jgi:hypothetical protein